MPYVTHAERAARLRDARLYLVTDTTPAGFTLAALLQQALGAGVDVVQLRDKHADDETLLAAATVMRTAADEAGALFIINDRPDLVRPMDADGVHIGQDDGALALAREAAGPDALVGRSTHAGAQFAAAVAEGADYAGVGPVYATPTKPGRDAVGLAYVREVAAASSASGDEIPWFAIGGIDTVNVGDVRDAGATRIAVVRAITEADHPAEVTATLRSALGEIR